MRDAKTNAMECWDRRLLAYRSSLPALPRAYGRITCTTFEYRKVRARFDETGAVQAGPVTPITCEMQRRWELDFDVPRIKRHPSYRGRLMHDAAVKEQFMVLRAQGKSFDAISKELRMRKPTLIEWGHCCKEEIANLKAIELDALRERFWLTTKAQTELFGGQLARVVEELGKRDLSDVPTPKLIDMLMKLNAKLEAVCPAPVISDETQIAEHKVLREALCSVTTAYDMRVYRKDDVTPKAEFLVSVLLTLLRRYEDGEIDERTVRTEVELIAPLLKGIELTNIERQNERILKLLQPSGEGDVWPERSTHA